MKYDEQMAALLACKIKGICQTESELTTALIERRDNIDDLFRSKIYDNEFIIAVLKILASGPE